MTEERTTLLEFPCEFPIKIMGARVDDFAQVVLEVVLTTRRISTPPRCRCALLPRATTSPSPAP